MNKRIVLLGGILLLATAAHAQKWLDKLGKKAENAAKQKVEQRVERKAGAATDKALDEVEGKNNKSDANSGNQPAGTPSNQPSKPIPATTNTVTAPAPPSFESYSKYDFIPGDRVIFFEDFSTTNVGDFPLAWNTNGSGEVVNTNLYPGKWLKFAGNKCIWTDALLKLPENYTIEFDIIPINADQGKGMDGWEFRLIQSINAKTWDGGSVPGQAGFKLGYEYFGRPYYNAYDNKVDGQFWNLNGFQDDKQFWEKENQLYHISIWIQKTRIRVYHGNGKMIDLPRAIPDPTTAFDRIRFEAGAAMVSNIRVAIAAPDMRSKLLTEGKLVSYGIYFDVNKDLVKPESFGTLKEIAQILSENPQVNIQIIGYTDSDGDDASNLDLSKRRAAAVKAALVQSFGIDASRIESDGKGEAMPVAKNDSPANKALNRRVEFIKQ